jgi:hypothetical protein
VAHSLAGFLYLIRGRCADGSTADILSLSTAFLFEGKFYKFHMKDDNSYRSTSLHLSVYKPTATGTMMHL